MENKKKFLSCNGAHKSLHHVIKMVSFWYLSRVITFLDSDAEEGTNILTAEALNQSLVKVNNINEDGLISKVQMDELCTNAGSRGTREGLAEELNHQNRTCDLSLFLVVTFTLHAMNRIMQSPCEKYFRDSTVRNRNVI